MCGFESHARHHSESDVITSDSFCPNEYMNHSSSPKFFSKMDDDGVVFMPAAVFELFWEKFLVAMNDNDFESDCGTKTQPIRSRQFTEKYCQSNSGVGRKKKHGALVTETVIDEHGTVKSERIVFSSKPETSFVKMATDALSEYFSKIPGAMYIPAFLAEMTSAYEEYPNCFFLDDPRTKERILKRIGVTKRRMNQIVASWVKCGFIHKIDNRGTYQVNPYLFSKGEFSDVGRLRIAFTMENERLKIAENARIAGEYDLCIPTDEENTLEMRLHVVVFEDDWEVKVSTDGAIVDIENAQVVGGGKTKKGDKTYLIVKKSSDAGATIFYEDDSCCLNLKSD